MAGMDAPLEVIDFKGGITDNYIDSPLDRYEIGDNFVIIPHAQYGKLLSRSGSKVYDTANARPVANRLGQLIYFDGKLWAISGRQIFYYDSGWNELVGPTSNKLLPTTADANTITTFSKWNDQLFISSDEQGPVQKIYADNLGAYQLRNAGLPTISSGPTFTVNTAGSVTHLYRIHYTYEYQVGTLTNIDYGGYATYEVEASDDTAPDITINNLPTLANTTSDNWDTANIKIQIYRTIGDGQIFYFVGEVTNGTTTFNDTVTDDDAQNNNPASGNQSPLLYTADGSAENGPVPNASVLHITQTKAYYGSVKDGTEFKKSLVYQSVPSDIDGVPDNFFAEVDDEVVAISSFKDVPIVMCDQFIYRLEGEFDVLGRGGFVPVKISDTAGCVNPNSAVQTPMGLFWAGRDGFYWSDGYQVRKITPHLEVRYAGITAIDAQKAVIKGRYDTLERRVHWTVRNDPSDGKDVDGYWVLHLDWGMREDGSMSFTTASNPDNFNPTALASDNGTIWYGDSLGYVFEHDEALTTDPVVNALVDPASWATKAIPWDYRGFATSFGDTMIRKLTNRITVSCKNVSDLSLQITSDSDDGAQVLDLKPIRFRGNFEWGDSEFIWGNPEFIWNFSGVIHAQRRFPNKSRRCSYKAIRLSNAVVALYKSDIYGQGTVDLGTGTVNLTDVDWPTSVQGQYIAFSNDSYTYEYLITGVSGTQITFQNTVGNPPSGTVDWVVRGSAKNEKIHLLGYSIHYIKMGRTQSIYSADSISTGENA